MADAAASPQRVVWYARSMGLLSFLFGRNARPFISEDAARRNLAHQCGMCLKTLAQLREHGVGEGASRRLEFFFYTNKRKQAVALAAALRQRGADADAKTAAGDRSLMLITGWSTAVPMTETAVVTWCREMCELGHRHDAEFDGWGTNV